MKKLSFFFTVTLCALTAQTILSSEGEGGVAIKNPNFLSIVLTLRAYSLQSLKEVFRNPIEAGLICKDIQALVKKSYAMRKDADALCKDSSALRSHSRAALVAARSETVNTRGAAIDTQLAAMHPQLAAIVTRGAAIETQFAALKTRFAAVNTRREKLFDPTT